MAADLFVVPTITFRILFVLVILGHGRRRIVHVAVSDYSTAAWTAQQVTEQSLTRAQIDFAIATAPDFWGKADTHETSP